MVKLLGFWIFCPYLVAQFEPRLPDGRYGISVLSCILRLLLVMIKFQ